VAQSNEYAGRFSLTKWLLLSAGALASAALLVAQSRGNAYGPSRIWWDADQGGFLPRAEDYDNAEGTSGMVNLSGIVRADDHAFFVALGTNGRACITCHQPSNSMSVSAATLRERWTETAGKDPVFAAIDGSNCPSLPQAAVASHSLTLNRGLFRIAMAWPPASVRPDFTIETVSDPTGCNTDPVYGIKGTKPAISVFRRPRVVANLASTTEAATGGTHGISLMADGREATLRTQAITAARTHEQMQGTPTTAQLTQILEFERQIFVAQSSDVRGGLLEDTRGPFTLGPQSLSEGKSGSPVGIVAALTPDAWLARPGVPVAGFQKEFRDSASRGSAVFLQHCASCHNENAASKPMDIGTANRVPREALKDLPLFRVTCATGQVIYTQDPARALVTGKCSDTGAIVPQQLRGLAARAPYFANGSAATLRDVVDFYDRRFATGYTSQEKQDLVNFLKTL
jgi:hypothetical protein